jgi:predicted ribosomally synthesized peptide with nif11-like leader
MSQAIATQFIQKVGQNEGLRAEIISAGQDMKAIVAIAAREGFSLSEADLQAASSNMSQASKELSADELATVAGGDNTPATKYSGWTGCGSGQGGCVSQTAYAGDLDRPYNLC